MSQERPLPLLGAIAGFFHWCEELLNILNGPILMAGAAIALVDLLTDGALTVSAPMLLFVWAGSQALGIDTQLLGCFARARAARGWQLAGWLVLGMVLAFAAWQAGYVFAVQQAEHITERAALAQLGMDPALWLGWRAFLAVGLVALSGWTRYRKPRPVTLEDEKAQLERELTLEPMRQAVRARKALGAVGLGRQVLDAARGKEAPEKPPTGPGTPSLVPVPDEDAGDALEDERQTSAPASPEVFPLEPSRQRRRKAAATVLRTKQRESVEALRETAAFALLDATPDMSANALQDALHCRWETADKLRRKWIRKRAHAVEAAQ